MILVDTCHLWTDPYVAFGNAVLLIPTQTMQNLHWVTPTVPRLWSLLARRPFFLEGKSDFEVSWCVQGIHWDPLGFRTPFLGKLSWFMDISTWSQYTQPEVDNFGDHNTVIQVFPKFRYSNYWKLRPSKTFSIETCHLFLAWTLANGYNFSGTTWDSQLYTQQPLWLLPSPTPS